MSWEAWVTLGVIAAAVYVLARDRYTPSVTLLTAVILLLVTGVITPEQAFSGFSNPAPITVAALYVLAAAVEKTGALQPIVGAVLKTPRGERRTLGRLLLPTASASAFLNNTPIVAMLSPQVSRWAERFGISPSRLLMPLSYASILGGMVTLIGTSTNVVVSGLLRDAGYAPFGMFELATIGLPVALTGIAALVILAPSLLPERAPAHRRAEEEAREFVVGMKIVPGGALDGKTVEGAGLRHLRGLFLVQIERERELIAPVGPTTVLHRGDRLTFVGRADQVVELQRMRGLVSTERDHMLTFDSPSHTFFEAVIGEASPLVGRTLRETDFRGRYQAAVVAIHRAGERIESKLGSVRLKVGDTLLLLGDPGFRRRWRDRSDFLLVSKLGGTPPTATRKAGLAAGVAAAMVALVAFGVLPILHASLLAALALLGMRVVTPGEARSAVDLDVVIIIAAAFGLGAAITQSGLAAIVAHVILAGFGGLGVTGAVLGIVLATILLTELITNNAAAVLMFPIALSVAGELSLDPRTVAIALAITASASFLTPIGYQTNTMVYGPGGYRFSDYARAGAPLTVIVVIMVVTLAALALVG